MANGKRKVIWAVDAFETSAEVLRGPIETLRELISREPDLSVEPVYVLSSAQLNLSSEFTVPSLADYRGPAEEAIQEVCRDLRVPNALRPKVLIQVYPGTSHAVASLSEYAYRSGAEMIVVASHGRKAIQRMLLGSFAEALLQTAKVPVLVANRRSPKPRKMDHLIFPTDFSSKSDLMYRRVVDLAVELRARITFYHAIPSPVEPVFSSGVYLLGGAWIPVRTYFSEEVERHQARAQAWARWARKQGVPVEVVIDSRASSISGAIVELAEREKAGLIAMDAQSGPVRSFLIGSIAKQVVRQAPCPVWIMRAGILRRARKGTRKATIPFPEAA